MQGCTVDVICDPTSKKSEGTFFMIVDNKLVNQVGYDQVSGPFYNQDATMLAYFARKGSALFLVENGKETSISTDNMGQIENMFFNPTSGALLYIYKGKDGKDHLIQDGKEIATYNYDEILYPGFTPKGQLIFTAFKGDTSSLPINCY